MYRNSIFLPIETTAREFEYKLALAIESAKDGNDVYIGQDYILDKIAKYIPAGVYVGKSCFRTTFPTDLKYYQNYKKLGWSVFYLDEEGAVFAGEDSEWHDALKLRIEPDLLSEDDMILTWGEFQKLSYENSSHSCQIVNTGTPRFDYGHPMHNKVIEERSKEIKEENYILFNMRFPRANPKGKAADFFVSNVKEKTDELENKKFKRGFFTQQVKVFSIYLETILYLATNYNNYTIAIRPHPSEDPEFYKNMFDGVNNVVIADSLSSSNWISKASCVVHDGCTTGIESYLLNKKVINFSPVENEEYEIKLPSMFGSNVRTKEELINSINSTDNKSQVVDLEYCKYFLSNLKGDIDSFGSVKSFINTSLENKNDIKKSIMKMVFYVKGAELAKRAVRFFTKGKYPKRHIKNKFLSFSSNPLINNFDALFGKEGVKINKISDNLILIRRK